MNGINNQLINPTIVQNLSAVDKGSEEEHQELIQFIQEKRIKPRSASLLRLSDISQQNALRLSNISQQSGLTYIDCTKHFPDGIPMGGEDVLILKPSVNLIHKKWTKEEDEIIIKLKQQREQKLTWADIAKYFPETTEDQCKFRWYRHLAPKSPIKHQKSIKHHKWTKEEDEQLIQLKQQQEPQLTWKDIAKYFPNKTGTQCRAHWDYALQPNPGRIRRNKKRKLIEEENNDERASKKLRTQLPDSSDELSLTEEDPSTVFAISSREEGLEKSDSSELQLVEPSPVDEPMKITDLSSNHLPSLQDVEEILFLPLYNYELAIKHFKEIQLMDPLFQNAQQEAAQCLTNFQITYQEMREKLITKEEGSSIIEQAKSLADLCQINACCLETCYQHFLSYQINQELKVWFASQSEEFSKLYLAFFKGEIDESNFHLLASLPIH